MRLTKDPRFEVDRRLLDKEWEGQPALFLEYAEQLAETNAEVDELKDRLENVKAELDGEARGELGEEGKKFTEAMVSAWIYREDRYLVALNDLREAQRKAAILKAEVQALDQRKAALENLVRLHGQEYYAVPTTTPEDRAEYNKTKANEAVRGAMNRRRK
jgi:hypothetical protein